MARPLFCWFGGKAKLVSWLSQYVPYGDGYCEPFCGAASLFFARCPSGVEFLNDLNDWVVNLFRVLRDPAGSVELRRRLELTPYSRSEFDAARRLLLSGQAATDVDKAWAFFVVQNQGFGGYDVRNQSWGRSVSRNQAGSFRDLVGCLDWFTDRLRGVHIECCDGVELIEFLDHDGMVFYVDPPYIPESRSLDSLSEYKFEMSLEDHCRLLDVLSGCRGAVVLSGYPSDLYNGLGWRCVSRDSFISSSLVKSSRRDRRVECLWLNRRCEEMLGLGGLFGS